MDLSKKETVQPRSQVLFLDIRDTGNEVGMSGENTPPCPMTVFFNLF